MSQMNYQAQALQSLHLQVLGLLSQGECFLFLLGKVSGKKKNVGEAEGHTLYPPVN